MCVDDIGIINDDHGYISSDPPMGLGSLNPE